MYKSNVNIVVSPEHYDNVYTTKVAFCSQFALYVEQYGINYEDLKKLFILDPRVNSGHTFIDRDNSYWDSHCLNKDVRAIAALITLIFC